MDKHKIKTEPADAFHLNLKYPSISIEYMLRSSETFEEFESKMTDEFLDEDKRVSYYLDQLVYEHDKKYATVSREAGLNSSYVGNIVNGKSPNPSRDVLIAICMAIGTTVDEVQCLLKYAGHAPLYVRRKRDVIIWFAFKKEMKIDQVDEILLARGYDPVFQGK